MKKTASFTIIEIVVVMLISSIVISAAVLIYENVEKDYFRKISQYESNYHLLMLNSLLVNDFDKSETLYSTQNQLVCNIKTSRVSYTFDEFFILRQSTEGTDTFYFAVENLFFKKNKLELLNDMSFSINFSTTPIPFHFSKKYPSSTLFNLNEQKNAY